MAKSKRTIKSDKPCPRCDGIVLLNKNMNPNFNHLCIECKSEDGKVYKRRAMYKRMARERRESLRRQEEAKKKVEKEYSYDWKAHIDGWDTIKERAE